MKEKDGGIASDAECGLYGSYIHVLWVGENTALTLQRTVDLG